MFKHKYYVAKGILCDIGNLRKRRVFMRLFGLLLWVCVWFWPRLCLIVRVFLCVRGFIVFNVMVGWVYGVGYGEMVLR